MNRKSFETAARGNDMEMIISHASRIRCLYNYFSHRKTCSRWVLATRGRVFFRAMLLTIAAVTICTALWLFRAAKKQRKPVPQLPPGPRGLPFVGYLPFVGTFLHTKFKELAAVYGPIYKLWFGNKLCVVITSPPLVKEVVRDNDIIFSYRDPPIAARILTFGRNDIAWADYGLEWKRMRKIFVREMLSKANLDACYALRQQEVKNIINDVDNKRGNPIDIGRLAFTGTTNAVIRMLGGGTIQGEKWRNFVAEFRNLTSQLMELLATPNVSDLFPILARFDLQGIERRSRKLSLSLEEILDSVINQYLNLRAAKKHEAEEGDNRKDILKILFDLIEHEESAGESITMNQLKAMMLDIVVAGTDSTSATVEWAMAELMLNQDIMEKVCHELDDVVGLNSVVEEFHLSKLRYLEAVVQETMRLHPAVPLLVPRYSNQSSIVGGYTIPKGTTVFLNVYAIQRDPHLWPKPLEFKPERFLNDNIGKYDFLGNNFQYLPFGSGRRVCAGLPLAEKMVMHMLASLLHSFEWKLPQGTELEMSEKFGIVVRKLKPLTLIPNHRLQNLELY